MRFRNPSQVQRLRELLEPDVYGPEEVALAEYYEEDAEHKLENSDERERYYGRHVVWLGVPGKMIEIDPEYTTAISGNCFEAEKLAAVANAVASRELVVFDAAYGVVGVVDAIDIGESQYEYLEEESVMERSYTSGSEIIDEYLMLRSRREIPVNSRAEQMIEQLRARRSGDFGKLTYVVRDGNHRVFGAILGGEYKIWMILAANQFQDVEQWRKLAAQGVRPRTPREAFLARISGELE